MELNAAPLRQFSRIGLLCLLLGGTAFMGTVAYSGQKFFEWQLDPARAQNTSRLSP